MLRTVLMLRRAGFLAAEAERRGVWHYLRLDFNGDGYDDLCVGTGLNGAVGLCETLVAQS